MSERPLKLARFLVEEHLTLARDRRRRQQLQRQKLRRRRSRQSSCSRSEQMQQHLLHGQDPVEEAVAEEDEQEEDDCARMAALFGDLPATSEVFCANLMTAACEVYFGAEELQETQTDGGGDKIYLVLFCADHITWFSHSQFHPRSLALLLLRWPASSLVGWSIGHCFQSTASSSNILYLREDK